MTHYLELLRVLYPYTSDKFCAFNTNWTMLHEFSELLELVAYKSGHKESFNRTVCI